MIMTLYFRSTVRPRTSVGTRRIPRPGSAVQDRVTRAYSLPNGLDENFDALIVSQIPTPQPQPGSGRRTEGSAVVNGGEMVVVNGQPGTDENVTTISTCTSVEEDKVSVDVTSASGSHDNQSITQEQILRHIHDQYVHNFGVEIKPPEEPATSNRSPRNRFTVRDSQRTKSPPRSKTSIKESQNDTDESSEEDGPEPSLENLGKTTVPELVLRPEKLDAMHVPEYPKGDRRRYDFDAENTDIPPYEFAYPFSEELKQVKFRLLANTDNDWRQLVSTKLDDKEATVIDRLLEIERLQVKTEELEDIRGRGRVFRPQKQKVPIGRLVRTRERQCCSDCLQAACAGDCTEKVGPSVERQGICSKCQERNCPGTCTKRTYEAHTRSTSTEADSTSPASDNKSDRVRPKSCGSCRKPHNASYINANLTVLGRPKSGLATFSHGQAASKQKDLRPTTPARTEDKNADELGEEFDRLDVSEGDASQRPTTPGGRLRGRASHLPGKSYFSQRRYSLTEDRPAFRAKSAGLRRSKRVKSAKKRNRPKTAS
jgi:hypothetical protein